MIGPFELQSDIQTNAAASVTFAAPGVGKHWAIHLITASYDTAIDGNITFTGLEASPTIFVGAGATENGVRGGVVKPDGALVGQDNTAVTVTLSSAGIGQQASLMVVARETTRAAL